MNVLIWSLTGLSSAFLIHLILWRVRLPKRQLRALISIFMLVLLATLLANSVLPPISPLSRFHISSFIEFFFWICLYLATTLSYAISYTAIEGESPSFTIVLAVHRAGPKGLSREQIQGLITDEGFIATRIDGLIQSKQILLNDQTQRFEIAPKGLQLLKVFLLPRQLLVGGSKGG